MHNLLIIDHLPSHATYVDLRDLCAPFGAVQWSRVNREAAGKSLRFGYVEMVDERAAARAERSLNGAAMDGLRLRVKRMSATMRPGWMS